jgi:ribosome biogenesis GTPase / thiamine phosphate phosphatase
MERLNGLVIRLQAGFYHVETEKGLISCQLPGRFKKRTIAEDIVAVGDRVKISLLTDETGTIEEIEERSSAFIRKAPVARGEYKQVLLANPDQVVLVFSCAEPEPHLRMLDRFLVIAEKEEIPPVIVANKVDLVGLEQAVALFNIYPPLGYPVLYASAKSGLGINELHDLLIGKISALAGPSGVGKSSLLNAIQPQLGLQVGQVSALTTKGRHTTVVRELFPLKDGGYVADMPGLRTLSLWDIEPEELDGYFPELRPLVSECRFNDCTHQMEPGCAVRQAVEEGRVHPERYISYLRIREGEEEDLPFS